MSRITCVHSNLCYASSVWVVCSKTTRCLCCVDQFQHAKNVEVWTGSWVIFLTTLTLFKLSHTTLNLFLLKTEYSGSPWWTLRTRASSHQQAHTSSTWPKAVVLEGAVWQSKHANVSLEAWRVSSNMAATLTDLRFANRCCLVALGSWDRSPCSYRVVGSFANMSSECRTMTVVHSSYNRHPTYECVARVGTTKDIVRCASHDIMDNVGCENKRLIRAHIRTNLDTH